MSNKFIVNPFTGKFDATKVLEEAIAHSDLSDMPDTAGTNTDHDARYYTEGEIDTLIGNYINKDGTTDLTGDWAISSNNITLTAGTLTAEHLYSTDDLVVDDDSYLKSQAFIGGVTSTVSAIGWDISADQILHLKCNDNAANSTVTDDSGNGYNGTLSNGATNYTSENTTTGKINSGFTFDGSSAITIGDNNDLDNGTNDFSISFWIKSTQSGANNFIIYHDAVSSNTGYNVQMTTSGAVRFKISDGSYTYADTGVVNDGNWYHIVGVFDRDDKLHIYVNASEVGSGTSITGEQGDISSVRDFGVGANVYGSSNYLTDTVLDDIRIIGRVITQEEIDALYNSGSGTESDSGAGATVTHQVIATTASYSSSHSLDSLADLAIEGELEVNSNAYIDGETTLADDMHILADSKKLYFGVGDDGSITHTGSSLDIQSDETTATDELNLRGGTNGIDFLIGATEQITLTDGKLAPTTDSDIDLGDSSHYYKNAYIDSITDGTATLTGGAVTSATIDCGSA